MTAAEPSPERIDANLDSVLLERVRELVCICRDGAIDEISDACARFLGADKATLRGRPFTDVVHADFRDALADGLDILAEDGALLKLERADGAVMDVAVEAAPLGDGAFMVTLRDISARTRQAQEMVDSEQRFRKMLDLTTDMISVWQNGRMAFINASGARMLGAVHASELLGCALEDVVHDSWREVASIGLEGLAEERHAVPLMFRRLDGTTVDVEVSVKPFGNQDGFMMDARDVTAQKRAAEGLRNSEQHLRHVVDSVADGIIVIDAANTVRSINRAAQRIFGYGASEAIGRPVQQLLSDMHFPEDRTWLEKGKRSTGMRASVVNREMAAHSKAGVVIPVELTITELHEGTETFRIGVVRDISERRKAEERIRHQASHDFLTDLPNRIHLYSRIEQFLAQNKRHGRQGALLLLNIDGFKLVNDTLGLQMGDRLLQAVARRLNHQLRTGEFIARLGGDDFVILQPEIAAPYEPAIAARRLIDSMEEPFNVDGFEISVSASIGIALFPRDAEEANGLVKNASAALFRAKEQGRASFSLFTADLNEVVNERLAIRSGLTKALEQGEFSLVYQPKVDLATHQMSGVEALLRWRSAEHGPVAPSRFIPVLEETSMIGTVGQWVIETACYQQRAWAEKGFPDIHVAVNLSVRQLRSGLVPMIENVLARTGVAPHLLEIEITESLLMRDTDNAVSMLWTLAGMGIQLAIDDFGTGYSSLSYLKRLPLNNIKIDRSFITDLEFDADSIEIVRTIIAMGHSLRRRIIAEGVETREQLEILRGLGADEVQGYFFSPPVAPEAILELLRKADAFVHPESAWAPGMAEP